MYIKCKYAEKLKVIAFLKDITHTHQRRAGAAITSVGADSKLRLFLR